MDNNNKKTFKVINFNKAYEVPVNKVNVSKQLVEWGKKNNYPTYILDLYNNYGSPTHKSIINKKVKLISGSGFEDILSPELQSIVSTSNLEIETKKVSMDYELFNGFAFEIIYDLSGNISTIQHIPFHKLRIGIKSEDIPYDYYWFSNDWSQYRKAIYSPEMIRSFNPLIKSGRQVYVYNEYNPQTEGSYPIASYSTAYNWIELDYQISVFHLNQAKQGYAPSFILNFATGIPTEEEMQQNSREIQDNYCGTENAGKMMITYSDDENGTPTLIPISLNDSDERFIQLSERTDEQITRASEIPPQLVILTPGKLGSSDERKELLREFQVSYITPRQNNIESVLKSIISAVGISEELVLKEFKIEESENKIIEEK